MPESERESSSSSSKARTKESTRHDKCAIALNNFYDAFAIKVGDGAEIYTHAHTHTQTHRELKTYYRHAYTVRKTWKRVCEIIETWFGLKCEGKEESDR